MAGANRLSTELAGLPQRSHPLADVAIAGEVVGSVHTGIASEQNLFLGQPGEPIAVGVGGAEMMQFDAMCAVIENHIATEEQGGWLKFAGGHIGAFLDLFLPAAGRSAVITRFAF